MAYRIGVDIGGTSVKLGVVDNEFNVIEKLRFPTGEEATSEGIINGIIDNCRMLCEKYDVEAIGIGSAGGVDSKRGMVVSAGNLPFVNEPVAIKVGEALNLPTLIENDGTCALIGERAAGVCKGADDTLIITIGTGIGGAMIVDGKIVRGHLKRAGELGHFIIDRNGIECECGLRGCFERYASATALIEVTEKAVQDNPNSILATVAKDGINGKTVFDANEMGCPVAKAILDEYGPILADGLNSLIHIFQPAVIALAGGIANQGESLIKLFEDKVYKHCKVATTSLNGNGGIIGAALLGTEYAR
ncbi:MAG: ROK family protein [Clostridia bacterium]|nr:ROK family protein [Clostridia bacterium]